MKLSPPANRRRRVPKLDVCIGTIVPFSGFSRLSSEFDLTFTVCERGRCSCDTVQWAVAERRNCRCRLVVDSAHSQRAGLINPRRPNQSTAHCLSGYIPPSRMLQRFTVRRMKREEKLFPYGDSARLRMLARCLKVHHVRSVACLNVLESTQAWP